MTKYMVFITPGPERNGTVINIPALDYDTVWPENGNDTQRILEELITDLSGEKPELVIPSFHVLLHKLTDEALNQIEQSRENPIILSYNNRDLADVLEGVVRQLEEVDTILADADEQIKAEGSAEGS